MLVLSGTGLAERFAGHGLTVTLIDTDPEQLDSARRNVETFERTSSLLGLAYTPSSNVSELVTYSDQVADLRGVDYVIENVTEDFFSQKGMCILPSMTCAGVRWSWRQTPHVYRLLGLLGCGPVPRIL